MKSTREKEAKLAMERFPAREVIVPPCRTDFQKLSEEGVLVMDNLLPPDHNKKLENILIHQNFPWNYSAGKVHVQDNDSYFVHIAKRAPNVSSDHKHIEKEIETEYWSYIYNFYDQLAIHCVARMQFNLNLPTTVVKPDCWHTDFTYSLAEENMMTAIYYITDSDGPTLFNQIGAVECKRNRAVVFKTGLLHAGCSHTTDNPRLVLNLNYYPTAPLPQYKDLERKKQDHKRISIA